MSSITPDTTPDVGAAVSTPAPLIRRVIDGQFFWVADEKDFQPLQLPPDKCTLNVPEGLAEYHRVANFIAYWYFARYGMPQHVAFYNLTHASFLFFQTCRMIEKSDDGAMFSDRYTVNGTENADLKNLEYYNKNPDFYPVHFGSSRQNNDIGHYLHIDESADAADVLNNIASCTSAFTAVVSRANLTDAEQGRTSYPIRGTRWWYTSWGTTPEVAPSQPVTTPLFAIPESDDPTTFGSLLGLTMIVKDAGEQFEHTLRQNLPLMDYWVIYDTGSTDGTIDIIRRVTTELGIPGRLYSDVIALEDLDFSVIRNRCLDWAGSRCTYFITLDDTYIAAPTIRKFLEDVAGDQFADTISVFINSADLYYASNRIIKTTHKCHRYKFRIHEVIDEHNNVNIIMPFELGQIYDKRSDYMETRTKQRKPYELQWLNEDLALYPNNPRPYYYMAQVYQLMGDSTKALEFYRRRITDPHQGYTQELYDATFEYARTASMTGREWGECLFYYNKCIELQPARAEPYYYIGMHHVINEKDRNIELAMEYFRRAFVLGNRPEQFQFGIRITLYNFYLPIQLMMYAHMVDDYAAGYAAATRFIENWEKCKNLVMPGEPERYNLEWAGSVYARYRNQTLMAEAKKGVVTPPTATAAPPPAKPIAVFIADGGYKPWSGTTILTEGVGGSETYIIEMATNMHKEGTFQVYVFCKCPVDIEIFNGVTYMPLDKVWDFLAKNYVHSCLVSRFVDYLPAVYMGAVENVYVIFHDIMPIGSLFIPHPKLKAIYCLSEWHANNTARNILTPYANLIRPFYYGCSGVSASRPGGHDKGGVKPAAAADMAKVKKVRWSFIYSSFPNRGLLPLLQMWGRIVAIQPRATLNLYCDLDGEWVNTAYPAQMAEIRALLAEYAADETTADSITVHGWVDKATLSAAWRTAEFWFYPCIFAETFCLTALECAASGTLAITNGLAALENTVGSRGITIPNWTVDAAVPVASASAAADAAATATADATETTKEEQITPTHPLWQARALETLTPFLQTRLDPDVAAEKSRLIAENQQWVANLTWQSRAKDMVTQWTGLYDYKMNYTGTRNLAAESWNAAREYILGALKPVTADHPVPNHVLDINAHTGMGAIELLTHIPQITHAPLSVHSAENVLLSGIHPDLYMQSIQNNVQRFIGSLPTKSDPPCIAPEFVLHSGDVMKSLVQLITTGFVGKFNIIMYTCTSTYDICANLHLIDELINKSGGILIINMLSHKEQLPHINYFFNSYGYKHKVAPVKDFYKDQSECVSVIQYMAAAVAAATP